MSILNKFLEVDFLISNILVPLTLLFFYCISFASIHQRFLPDGVNFIFVNRLWKYVLLLLGISLIFFIIIKLKKGYKFVFKNNIEKIFFSDLILLLLPMTPIVQYILNNQDILSPIESLSILAFFVVFSGLYILVFPVFFGTVGSTRLLMILGSAFAFSITSMASLSQYFSWFGEGSLKIQLTFFGGVFLVMWFLLNLNNKKVLFYLIAVNFLTNSFIQLVSQDGNKNVASFPVEDNQLLSFVVDSDKIPAITPNIYLLIYDSYVPNETMLSYGFDNSLQEDFLKKQGFTLYPHTYSVGPGTVSSMSRVLNASTEFYGPARKGVSGDGIVQNILSKLGYETYGLFSSDFMFRGIDPSYDFLIPKNNKSPYDLLLSAILFGEFSFDIGFKEQTSEQFYDNKRSVLESISENSVFVYSHSMSPGHSQNSGACRTDEIDLYKERLAKANLEMQQDLETVIENDTDAIIIVAGDHGPYLTKNCTATNVDYEISEINRLDIQDRYGSFLAIRWPTKDYEKYDDITVLQDLFPVIYAYLYKDVRILESKVESSTFYFIEVISGASVKDGIIYGGINDGEQLFISDQ
jgi:hypothetical protein